MYESFGFDLLEFLFDFMRGVGYNLVCVGWRLGLLL